MSTRTLTLQLLETPREGGGRLAAALAISICLHGALIAWRFASPPPPAPVESTLEITLVNASGDTAPPRPQALAQQSLDGGGEQASGLAATPLPRTTDQSADELVLEAMRRRQAELEAEQQALLTRLESLDLVAAPRRRPELLGSHQDPGDENHDQDSLVLNARIAALKARIERYNAQPRRIYAAPSTQAVDYARYVEAWRKRIELIGTEHYPPEARGRIYGSLQVTVYIRSDGSLERVDIQRPSNQAVLNSAARRIVELAAPFEPLPAALAAKTDSLVITRTWRFTNDRLDTDP
ncbi:energy transducer TonB [Castellaniella sp. GW247-6E4]|uniref:energy transducer TonB n=1 Tax=Castellaniella sp. GW247-6E4 TaxID=3140380 RepID=UPI0033148B30